MLRAYVPALLMVLGSAGHAAETANRTCQREVVTVRTSLIKNVVRLERVKSSERKDQCLAYRQYADVVDKARKVFVRCNADQELDKDVSGLDAALSDVQAAIASRCHED